MNTSSVVSTLATVNYAFKDEIGVSQREAYSAMGEYEELTGKCIYISSASIFALNMRCRNAEYCRQDNSSELLLSVLGEMLSSISHMWRAVEDVREGLPGVTELQDLTRDVFYDRADSLTHCIDLFLSVYLFIMNPDDGSFELQDESWDQLFINYYNVVFHFEVILSAFEMDGLKLTLDYEAFLKDQDIKPGNSGL